MPNVLKALKPWQVAVLVVLLLGIAGGGYALYNWAAGPSTPDLPDDIELVQVQYGDIVNSISASGSLIFPNREELIFGNSGTVGEVAVQEGDTVEAGQLLARLDDASVVSLQEAVAQARFNLRDAEDGLDEAEDPYSAPSELDMTRAEAAVVNAEVTLLAAQENLQRAENPYTESDILEAELAVMNAEAALEVAQDAFDIIEPLHKSSPRYEPWKIDYERKLRLLALADNDLIAAEDAVAEIEAGADPLEVEQQRKQLAVAEASLAEAEDDLAELLEEEDAIEIDDLEVALRQAAVASAQVTLDEATQRLEMATMVAPVGGVVSSVTIEEGEEVAPDKVVMVVVDHSVVEVSAVLDEIDVSQVIEGQRVSVTLDALPNQTLAGEVSSISTVARVQSGVVTYPFTVAIDLPAGVQLREGMSATASVVIEEAAGVLLIPSQAIGGSFTAPVVSVMINEEMEQRAVTLGISDGYWTEVLAGLQESDTVVVAATASGTSFPGMPGGFGGGFGGFGGGFR